MNHTSIAVTLRRLGVLLAVCLSFPLSARAQSERELEAVHQRIQQLVRKAEELRDLGRADAAEETMKRAIELRTRVARDLERRRAQQGDDDYYGVFNHLERAIDALRKLERAGYAEHLEEVAQELRRDLSRSRERARDEDDEHQAGEDEDLERDGAERRELRRRLTVMGYAKAAFAEAEMGDALELIERAMHAREIALSGRRDEEAMRIRERAPELERQIELLKRAVPVLEDLRAGEKAQAVARLADQLAAAGGDRPRRPGGGERELAMHQLEVMKIARGALREADRPDAAEGLHRAIRALEVTLEGRRDEEALEIRRRAPSRGAQAELLMYAARTLGELDRPDRAEMVADLGQQLAARERAAQRRTEERERAERRRPESEERAVGEGNAELRERLARLEDRLAELRARVREIESRQNRRRR